jgi:hypothetical protein
VGCSPCGGAACAWRTLPSGPPTAGPGMSSKAVCVGRAVDVSLLAMRLSQCANEE